MASEERQNRGARLAAHMLSVLVVIVVASHAHGAAYESAFDGGVGDEWLPATLSHSPSGEVFLGPFRDETVRLSLTDLDPHQSVRVEFDLFIIGTWDGSNPVSGVDIWNLAVVDGPALVRTTFSNAPGVVQAYTRPPTETSTLGYTPGHSHGHVGDSVYHISVDFDHVGAHLALDFAGSQVEWSRDPPEAWGLDDVRVELLRDRAVTVSTVPTPPHHVRTHPRFEPSFAQAVGFNELIVTWEPPTADGGAEVMSYAVLATPTEPGFGGRRTQTAVVLPHSQILNGRLACALDIDPGRAYAVHVIAVNEFGNISISDATEPVVLAQPESDRLIEMEHAYGSISGRIVDPVGDPVADLPLSIVSAALKGEDASPDLTQIAHVVSDAQGAFRFDSVSPGAYGLEVGRSTASDESMRYRVAGVELSNAVLDVRPLLVVEAGAALEDLVVTAERLARISGTVHTATSSGQAVHYVRLDMVTSDTNESRTRVVRGLRRTGEDGGYLFLVAEPGTYRVSVMAGEPIVRSDPVRVQEGGDYDDVDLTLPDEESPTIEATSDVYVEDDVRTDVPPPEPYFRVVHANIVVRLETSGSGRVAHLRVDVELLYPIEAQSDAELIEKMRGDAAELAIRAGLDGLSTVEELVADPHVIETVADAVRHGVRQAGLPVPERVRVTRFLIQ